MTVNVSLREKGQYPISIGTSLAIEGAMGIHPEFTLPTPPLLKYKEVWFNCFTLFRNMMSSMRGEDQRAALITDLHPALVEDILGCYGLIDQLSKGRTAAKFYLPDYTDFAKTYPAAKLKTAHTPFQEVYQALEEATLLRLLRDPPVEITRFKGHVQGMHPSALMVTHFPYDLLARYRFERLDLLESHTGHIKPASQWNTKLNVKPEEASHLPFTMFTLQICGDGQQFVMPSRKLRNQLLDVAHEGNWSSVTTQEKIKFTVEKFVKDPDLLQEFKRYY
jgi:hypothetical protein